ncbi:MAG: hypothetical protein H6736_02165 [Alphaproteobacteria bacterium]|nr:hypothetical protein [Alphaproteobacteria bacterium]
MNPILFGGLLALTLLLPTAQASEETDCALAICQQECADGLLPFKQSCQFCDFAEGNCQTVECITQFEGCLPGEICDLLYEEMVNGLCIQSNSHAGCIQEVLETTTQCSSDPVGSAVSQGLTGATDAYVAAFGPANVPTDSQPFADDLQAALDALVAGGCLDIAETTQWASGYFGRREGAGEDESGPLTDVALQRKARTFGFVRSDGITVGSAGGHTSTYTYSRSLAATSAPNGFFVGRNVVVQGTRGVWVGLTGTCDADVDPLPILLSTWL